MNKANKHPLLEAVLVEPELFHATMLDSTLRAVRRRKRNQKWQRGLGSLVLLISLALIGWQYYPRQNRFVVRPQTAFRMVTSQPLGASAITKTQRSNLNWVTSSHSAITVVETKPVPEAVREVNDDQLLALLSDHPAVLVQQNPTHSELIFLTPDDRENGSPN